MPPAHKSPHTLPPTHMVWGLCRCMRAPAVSGGQPECYVAMPSCQQQHIDTPMALAIGRSMAHDLSSHPHTAPNHEPSRTHTKAGRACCTTANALAHADMPKWYAHERGGGQIVVTFVLG